MATIEKYQTSSGTKPLPRSLRHARQQIDAESRLQAQDAQGWANSVEVNKMTGEYIAPLLGRITVAELHR